MFTRSSQFDLRQKPLTWGLLVVVLVGLNLPTTAMAQAPAKKNPGLWANSTDLSDSTTSGREEYWGPIPVRDDSVAREFREKPRPAWETAVLAPYWVVGLPLRAVYWLGDEGIKGADKLGLLGPPGKYPGLPGPLGTYLMPSLSIKDVEGTTFGVKVTRPEFLNEDHLLFFRASRSTKRAGAYAGGGLFKLGENWELELGAGFESVNQTRYYGLGPAARSGALSYYYRGTRWGGMHLNHNLSDKVKTSLRAYFSRIEVRDADFNDALTVTHVHGGDLPPGYPGASDGLTIRWGLNHDSTEQKGRPSYGGYHAVGVSMFVANDGTDLRYLTWHANLEKYFKLWHTDRTLVVRGFGNRISSLGQGEVPFSRLITFQRPDQLRGYSSFRFYGLGSVGVSVEYRWPLWVVRDRDDVGVDAYLFSDSGQVFDHTNDISLTNFLWTGGAGLRLITGEKGMSTRFELGFSEDNVAIRLTFSQTFQYNPRGFLYGKNPTKLR